MASVAAAIAARCCRRPQSHAYCRCFAVTTGTKEAPSPPGPPPRAIPPTETIPPPPPGGPSDAYRLSSTGCFSIGLAELNALAAVGDVRAATERFEQLQVLPGDHGKRTVLWNTVLKAYAKAGDFSGAVAWYETMSSEGVRTNAKTIGKLLESAANAGHLEGAERWLSKLHPPRSPVIERALTSGVFTTTSVGITVDCTADSTAGPSASSTAGSTHGVAAVGPAKANASIAFKDNVNEDTFVGLAVSASARAGDAERAAAWLQRMRKSKLNIGEDPYSSLIGVFALGDSSAAEQWFHMAVEEDPRAAAPGSSTLSAIIGACGRAGDWANALRRLEESMAAEGPLPAASSTKPFRDGTELEMRQRRARGVKPDTVSYTALADAFAKKGDRVGAAHWLATMEESRCEPNVVSFNTLIDACARQGDIIEASRWFGSMLKKGVPPNEYTYNTLISGCARRRQPEEAAEWLSQMIDISLPPDRVSYNAVINAFANSGDTPGAASWLRAMAGARVVPDEISYVTVISSCSKRGDVAEASRWLASMQEAGLSAPVAAHNSVIAACAARGDPHSAQEFFHAMSRAAVRPDVVSHNSVISSFARGGDATGALRWLEGMAASGHAPNEITYNSVVAACAKVGDADGVAELLERMTSADIEPSVVTWTSMVTACANAIPRRSDAAERVFQRMVQIGVAPNRLTLRALGRAVGGRRRAELLVELGLRDAVAASANGAAAKGGTAEGDTPGHPASGSAVGPTGGPEGRHGRAAFESDDADARTEIS